MQKSGLNDIVESGHTEGPEFKDRLNRLFLAFHQGEGVSPVALLENINKRLIPIPSMDQYDDLTITLYEKTPDNLNATFDKAIKNMHIKRSKYKKIKLEKMKFELLGAMLDYVVNHATNEDNQAIIDALFVHGSEQDRATLRSIGKTSKARAVGFLTGFLGISQTPNATEIMQNKLAKQQEIAKLLAGVPEENDSIPDALEPFKNRHGYTLSLASPGPNPEKRKIYLEMLDRSSLKYTVVDPHGKIQERVLSINELVEKGTESEKINRKRLLKQILRNPLNQEECERELLPSILRIAIEANHAHIDFSFVDSIQNEEVKSLIKEAREIPTDLFEKTKSPELLDKVSTAGLSQIALAHETLARYIFSLRYAIEKSGDSLPSHQKLAIYRQLDRLNTALLKSQDRLVEAMVRRLDLLKPEVLNNLSASDPEQSYACDKRVEEIKEDEEMQRLLEKASKFGDTPESPESFERIKALDIIKYLAYIAKVGNDEQCKALYPMLPNRVKTDKKSMTLWVQSKLESWKERFSENDIEFIVSFLDANKAFYQSPADQRRNVLTISQFDFALIFNLKKAINSFQNKEAMDKVMQEAKQTGYFNNLDAFREFCSVLTPTNKDGAALFARFIPFLEESSVSPLILISQIKVIANDPARIAVVNKIADKFKEAITLQQLNSITDTEREIGSAFATVPFIFIEQCIKESDTLEELFEKMTRVNDIIHETPLLTILGNTLTAQEILSLISSEPHDKKNIEAILEDFKSKLGESTLHFVEEMIKIMKTNKIIPSNDKDKIIEATQLAILIVNSTNDIIRNCPQYPDNKEELKKLFSILLEHISTFEMKYGNTPQASGVIHQVLKKMAKDMNIELLNLEPEQFDRDELKFFMAAIRRLDSQPESEKATTKGLQIEIELEPEMVNTAGQNGKLVEAAFEAAEAKLDLQKVLEKKEQFSAVHSELEKRIEQMAYDRHEKIMKEAKLDRQKALEKKEEFSAVHSELKKHIKQRGEFSPAYARREKRMKADLQKRREKSKQFSAVHSELKMLTKTMVEVTTGPGHRPIETIRAAHALMKIKEEGQSILLLKFAVKALSFLEIFYHYPPRARLIEKYQRVISKLSHQTTGEQKTRPVRPADDGKIFNKPEKRPPPPTSPPPTIDDNKKPRK